MAITTLRKFLNADRPVPEPVRLLQLLLNGIGAHAVESDPLEAKHFRIEMSNLAEELAESLSPNQMQLVVARALQSLEAYNEAAARLETANKTELRTLLTMMADTIAFLSVSSTTDVERLQLIEKSIEKASALNDIRSLRIQLNDCLAAVREASVRTREASQARIASLQAHIQRSRRQTVTPEPLDAATGLPGRTAAEHLIEARIAEATPFAVALFVVDRVASINGRFGRTVGDYIMLSVAQHLGQEPSNIRSLLRWSGPAFVMVAAIEPNINELERLVRRLGSMRLQKDIDTGEGSVMLAITCSWILETVTSQDSPQAFCRKLDAFVAARSA